jgi:hypothetical protein
VSLDGTQTAQVLVAVGDLLSAVCSGTDAGIGLDAAYTTAVDSLRGWGGDYLRKQLSARGGQRLDRAPSRLEKVASEIGAPALASLASQIARHCADDRTQLDCGHLRHLSALSADHGFRLLFDRGATAHR